MGEFVEFCLVSKLCPTCEFFHTGYIVNYFTKWTLVWLCPNCVLSKSDCEVFHNDTLGYVVYTHVRTCAGTHARICPYRDFYRGERSFDFLFKIGIKIFFNFFSKTYWPPRPTMIFYYCRRGGAQNPPTVFDKFVECAQTKKNKKSIDLKNPIC